VVARTLEEGSRAKMYRLYRFRIHKIISIALLSFAGLLSFGGIYQINSGSQDVSCAVADNAASIADLNPRISINVLDARWAEKDCQLRHVETYSKLQAELSTSINHELDQLKVLVRGQRQPLNDPPILRVTTSTEGAFL
jgi:hypothetical protein